MKKMLSLGIAVALMAMACAAYAAYPTLLGPTGNGVLPTAAVQPAGQLSAALDLYNTDDDDLGVGNTLPLRVVYGVTPNLEIGAGYTKVSTDGDDITMWNVNAKYATPVNLLGFAWSAGLVYGSADIAGGDITATQLYWVGDRTIALAENTPALNVTAGVNWTQIDPDGGDTLDAFRFFGGVSAAITPKLTGSLEMQSAAGDFDEKPMGAITLRYAFTPALTAQVGYTNSFLGVIGNTDIDGEATYNPFVGINYTFGGMAADEDEF